MDSEGYKNKIVEDFRIYITGMYILQPDFINDLEGGLKSVLENYIISHTNDIEVPIKVVENTKKKSTTKNEPVLKEEQYISEEELSVKEENNSEINEVNRVNRVNAMNGTNAMNGANENNSVPQSVIDRLNEISISQTKPKKEKNVKPKKESKPKKEKDDKPKKKKALSPYNIFVKDFSAKNPGLSKDIRMTRIGEEWDAVKNDPERFNYYVNTAKEENLKNDQAFEEITNEE
jgi:hypothetical protein